MALLASEKPEHLLYTQANDLLFHQVKLSITHNLSSPQTNTGCEFVLTRVCAISLGCSKQASEVQNMKVRESIPYHPVLYK